MAGAYKHRALNEKMHKLYLNVLMAVALTRDPAPDAEEFLAHTGNVNCLKVEPRLISTRRNALVGESWPTL